MIITKQTLDFIKKWEGFRAKAYKCPAGIWTIGYGSTIYPNSQIVCEGDIINEIDATFCLCKHLEKYCYKAVIDIENKLGKLNDNQKTAILSLVYNIGLGAFNKSKCKYFIEQNDKINACKNWDWIKTNNTIVKGLVDRRNMEIELFYGVKNFWSFNK